MSKVSRKRPLAEPAQWSIWILAGGQSRRMGRDKSRIIVGGKTLLQRVREHATATGWPVRVIRQDVVAKCGPLSGIVTGLTRSRADWNLFLTCDMPRVSADLLRWLMRSAERKRSAVISWTSEGFGFPLALPGETLAVVEALIASGKPSLQRMAAELAVQPIPTPTRFVSAMENLNTPEELARYRQELAAQGK